MGGRPKIAVDKPPYFIELRSGCYWQPNKAIRAMGFAPEALGKDRVPALSRARDLNAQVAAVRAGLAAEAPPAVHVGSFRDLADVYRGNPGRGIDPSRDWRKLAPRTQQDYGEHVDFLVELWGDGMVKDLTAENVAELHEKMASAPYQANYRLSVLRALLNVAVAKPSRFGLTSNPAQAVKKFGKLEGVRPRQVYWQWSDDKRFRLAALKAGDWEVYVGQMLLAYTGQRPADVRAMEWSDYDGQRIRVTQQKTRARVWIHVHRDLKRVLDLHLRRRKAAERIGGTILQTDGGKAFKERYFAERWDIVAAMAGTAKLQRRDLRRTAVVRLAEAACTIPEIAAITGHTIKSVETIIETYLVQTYPQAKAAIVKLEDYRRELAKEARRGSKSLKASAA